MVAEAIAAGISANTFEIYVGEAASQRAAFLADPVKAVEALNAGMY